MRPRTELWREARAGLEPEEPVPVTSKTVLRIANASGFYGDRLSAAREMVEGGPIDVLTGDYLAELTLSLLARDQRVDPQLGYAKTFLVQLRQIAASCLTRGIKIVVNAGGLNPAGCAGACRAVYAELGLDARVAHLEGDDLLPRVASLRAAGERFTHLDHGVDLDTLDAPLLSANAYLGGWGIARALALGADLVICGRVTDAALVVGPAAWHFGWARDDWDRLAGAVVAGHVLECGAQATGGNYAFFREVGGLEDPGFPLAEIAEDGSCVITKHPGTGGQVSIGTVTAQLLYEIDAPRYRNPDVTARFDTIALSQDGPDRVRITGARGEPPPPLTKVCINHAGGFRNQVTFLLTGLDLEAKARLAARTFWRRLGDRDAFDDTRVTLHRADGGASIDAATSFLTIAVRDGDRARVGRRFARVAVEMALASYPGFNLTAPPGDARPCSVYWPALVATEHVTQRVMFEGQTHAVTPTPGVEPDVEPDVEPEVTVPGPMPATPGREAPTTTVPLGRLLGTRSGDKGGNANLGVWAATDAVHAWMTAFLTIDRLRALLPGTDDLVIERHALPNLRALNFVLRGFLGAGVASSLAVDPQAKGLGEFLRARVVPVPRALLVDDVAGIAAT